MGPHGTVVGVLDAAGLFRAAGEFAIPIDQVFVEVRRVSDNSVAFTQTLSSSEFNTSATTLSIRIQLDLRSRSEDFSFTVTARSGGVDYYQASGSITAAAFETVQTAPIAAVYIGPGANADGLSLPATTFLGSGQSATITAAVTADGTPVSGVPIVFESNDSSLIIPVRQGLDQARVTAPAAGSGSVTISARTPTGLTASGVVSWSPQAAAIVLISGDGQTVQTGAAAAAPLVVEVRDAQGGAVQGTDVTFAVATGPTGTTVTPTAATSDPQGRAQTILTAGPTAGAITVTATAPGLTGSPVTFNATATTSVGVPASVTANSAVTQSATVNTAVAAPPSVVVRDANGTAVPSVGVTFAVTGGGGSITGATQTTNSSGIATVGSWTVGQTAGAIAGVNTLTATVGTLPAVTFTANATAGPPASVTLVSGDNQTALTATALPAPLVVEVRDGFSNPVTGATVTWSPSDGSATPASGPTGTTGQAQTSWTLGANQLNPTLVAAVAGAGSVTFHATTTFPAPTILLGTTGPSLVGVGLSNTVNITLSQAAPVNGLTVNLSSDNTSTVSLPAPSVFIAQGGTTGSFTINGVSAGTTTVRAAGTGYTAGALSVTATLQIVSLPATLNVPFGQNQVVPINLAVPAPTGGVNVTLASSDATRVAIVVGNITIPQGSQIGSGTVFGQFPGPSTLTASAPGFVSAASAATTTAALNIVQTSATLNASFGTTVTIELRSGATTVPAPAGGLTVDLSSSNGACMAVPSTVTIPQGLVNTTALLTYGGTATTPCSATLTASAANITSDQINVTVNPTPTINLSTPAQGTGRLGNGLQDAAGGFLQVPTTVATTVRVASGDQSVLLISATDSTPGGQFADIPVPINGQSFTYYTQAIGVSPTPVTITASSTNYTDGTTTVTLVAPAIDLGNVTAVQTTLGANDPFVVRVGVPNVGNTSFSAFQAVRAGSPPVVATITNSDGAVARLVTASDTSPSQETVTVVPRANTSPSTVALGGVAFDPLAAGTTTVAVTSPGFVTFTSSTVVVTVSAPNITLSAPAQGTSRVGNGLQDAAGGFLQSPTPVATTVRVSSGDQTALLISATDSTPGGQFADIPVPINGQSFTYYVQGVGLSTGPVTITASSTNYSNGTTQITVAAPAMDLSGIPATTTTFAANDPFVVRIGVINAGNTGFSAFQTIRAGSSPLTATITNSNGAVARLVKTADTSTTQETVTIGPHATTSPGSVAAGGVAFDPLAAGTTTVTGSIPGFTSLAGATIGVAVSAPNITLSTPAQGTGRVGNGLQDAAGGFLQSPTPVATTVRVSSGDQTALLISATDSTPGGQFADIPVPINGQSFTYYVQGVGLSTGPVTITASSTNYNNGTTQVTVAAPAMDLSGIPATTTTLSANDPFVVRIGVINAANNSFSAFQAIRAGSAPLTATIRNSNGTVAQLVTTPTTGNQVTVTIGPKASSSPGSVALGGVAFDPLAGGSTVVTGSIPGFTELSGDTVNVAVNAPTITLSATGQGTGLIGQGLQDAASGFLQVGAPGPLTLRVESSNEQFALVSKDANTPGSKFIDIPIVANGQSFTYYIQGVEGASGTVQITATAPGYSTGQTNATVTQAAMQLTGLVSSIPSTAANDVFQVIVGVPNTNRTSMQVFQAVRAGGTPLTASIHNSNGVAAQLVTNATTGNDVTVSVQPTQSTSPNAVALGGVAFDPLTPGSTTVTATITGLVSLPTALVNVTVGP